MMGNLKDDQIEALFLMHEQHTSHRTLRILSLAQIVRILRRKSCAADSQIPPPWACRKLHRQS